MRFFFHLTGFTHRRVGPFGSSLFHRGHQSPLREICSELQFLPGEKPSDSAAGGSRDLRISGLPLIFVFKFGSRVEVLRRFDQSPEKQRLVSLLRQNLTPTRQLSLRSDAWRLIFIVYVTKMNSLKKKNCPLPSQGLLQKEKSPEVQSLDQIVKQKNVPDNQQEAFRTGFSEGFMRSQAYTQRTQGVSICWRPGFSSKFLLLPKDALINLHPTSVFDRLSEENQVAPAGPPTHWDFCPVKKPFSLW